MNAAQLLGVPADADPATVRAAFREAARTHHPDVGGCPARFAALTAARDELLASSFEARREGVDEEGDDGLIWEPQHIQISRPTRPADHKQQRPLPPLWFLTADHPPETSP